MSITTDNSNLYGISEDGYVIKTELDLDLVDAKQISGYNFINITQNTNYIATYRYNNSYGVVIIKKDLSNSININTNDYHNQVPLMDNNYLYLIDESKNNKLLVVKIDITNLSNLSVSSSKEYNWNSLEGSCSGAFLSDGNIVIGINTSESPNNLIFLKINKNDLSIMNQIKLSAKGGGNSRIVLMNIFPTLDGGFFAARFINGGNVGYALKMPSDFNLGNNCVFNVSNPNITENSYSYTLNTTVPTLTNVTLTEDSIPTLTEVNIDTFVGCMNPAPNINGNINGNREGNNNTAPATGKTNRK